MTEIREMAFTIDGQFLSVAHRSSSDAREPIQQDTLGTRPTRERGSLNTRSLHGVQVLSVVVGSIQESFFVIRFR